MSISLFPHDQTACESVQRLLRKNAEAYGALDCPAEYISDTGYGLGVWVKKQRLKYKKNQLTAEQIRRLEAIGML